MWRSRWLWRLIRRFDPRVVALVPQRAVAGRTRSSVGGALRIRMRFIDELGGHVGFRVRPRDYRAHRCRFDVRAPVGSPLSRAGVHNIAARGLRWARPSGRVLGAARRGPFGWRPHTRWGVVGVRLLRRGTDPELRGKARGRLGSDSPQGSAARTAGSQPSNASNTSSAKSTLPNGALTWIP